MGSAEQLIGSSRSTPAPVDGDDPSALSTRAAWLVLGVSVVSRSLLSTIVALLLWGVLPDLVGFQTTPVMSGSLTPVLQVGDVVVVRPVDAATLVPGQVLLFDDPDHAGRLRLHRLVALDDGRLVTRGDANRDRDSSTVPITAVHGAGFLRVPFAGLPDHWIRSGQPVPLVGTALLMLALLGGVRLGRRLDVPEGGGAGGRVRSKSVPQVAAAGAVLLLIGVPAVSPHSSAQAAFTGSVQNAANTWQTRCGDVDPQLPQSAAQLLWGYGGTGSAVVDASGHGVDGVLSGDAVRTGCTAGSSPSFVLGGGSGAAGLVSEQNPRPFPGDMTVATWFRTSSAGGVLADFGGSNSVTTPSAANAIDRVLFMRADGNLTFASSTLSLLSLTAGTISCTTTGTGYADGAWHLVVATYSDATGCTIGVDEGPVVSQAPALTLRALTGYPGYWRFGYDAVPVGSTPDAAPRQYFVGALDESQVYASVLTPVSRRALLTAKR